MLKNSAWRSHKYAITTNEGDNWKAKVNKPTNLTMQTNKQIIVQKLAEIFYPIKTLLPMPGSV